MVNGIVKREIGYRKCKISIYIDPPALAARFVGSIEVHGIFDNLTFC